MPKRKRPTRTRGAEPHSKPTETPAATPAHDERAMPRAFWEAAAGKSVTSPEVLAVIEQLGGKYELHEYEPSTTRFDPDIAESVRWEFPDAPKANVYASHLRVQHNACTQLVLSPALVADEKIPRRWGGTLIGAAEPDIQVFSPYGPEWHWAPQITRRGDQYLLNLDVPQGHWDGNYKFRLTDRQAQSLQDDLVTYRKLWDALVGIAHSRRFFNDPGTIRRDAQARIDDLLGRG